MKMKINPLMVATALVFATPAVADDIHETATTNLAHGISNLPRKSLVAVELNYPPGSLRPHRHAKSAFIYAYVVSGTIESQVEGEPAHSYRAGESFVEPPGAHHVLGRNVSATEPAKLLAVFVVDTADKEPPPLIDKDTLS
jgi:quercetin dioxygenase-like cupin family protein